MKKLFFTLLTVCLAMPFSAWADDHNSDHNSGQVSDDEVYDGEQDDEYGSIVPSDIQLTYKILSQPTGTYGEEGYTAGTVELEGVYSIPTGVTSYSISVPHEIQVVNVNMTTLTADVALYTVVGIQNGAFGSYTAANADLYLTSITIPQTVTYLGADDNAVMVSGCFANCTNLKSVIYAGTSAVETIGTNAFYKCSGLTSLEIPSTVTTIASNAFAYCTGLTEVKIPEGVTSLGSNEFQSCTKLVTVWLPGSINLTARIFDSCTSLRNIVLEGGPGTNGGNEGSNAFANDNGEEITLYVETGRAAEYIASAWETDLENDTNEKLSWNFNEIGIYYDFYEEDESGSIINYATYYTDAVGEFGDDITPNIVTKAAEEGTITYNALTGYIPANTGLLLSVEATSVPTADFSTYYYHPYETTISEVSTADVSSNMLLGTNDEGGITTVGPNGESSGYYFYKLTLDSSETAGSVGFYWGAEGGAAFKSNANKAYLAVPKDEATPSSLTFKKEEGEATGITAVETATESAKKGIYTISGVRVNDMSKAGLYIVDGKKVLVK